jgi:hypothetical protein
LEDSLAKQRMKGSVGVSIHVDSEQLRQIWLQTDMIQERRPLGKLNRQVEITALSLLATGEGTEDPDPETSPGPEDWLNLFTNRSHSRCHGRKMGRDPEKEPEKPCVSGSQPQPGLASPGDSSNG